MSRDLTKEGQLLLQAAMNFGQDQGNRALQNLEEELRRMHASDEEIADFKRWAIEHCRNAELHYLLGETNSKYFLIMHEYMQKIRRLFNDQNQPNPITPTIPVVQQASPPPSNPTAPDDAESQRDQHHNEPSLSSMPAPKTELKTKYASAPFVRESADDFAKRVPKGSFRRKLLEIFSFSDLLKLPEEPKPAVAAPVAPAESAALVKSDEKKPDEKKELKKEEKPAEKKAA